MRLPLKVTHRLVVTSTDSEAPDIAVRLWRPRRLLGRLGLGTLPPALMVEVTFDPVDWDDPDNTLEVASPDWDRLVVPPNSG